MQKTILVIGGTGYLGGKVVAHLREQNIHTRALVRQNSDASYLESQGVTVFIGDINNKNSLAEAMEGVDAVITTAIGYVPRKKGDSIKTDDIGNKNLADVAKHLNIPKFIFTSILTCDKAKTVPHFWQKKLSEDYFNKIGLPYIALRPGAFLDQNPKMDFYLQGLKKRNLKVLGSTNIRWSNILTDDLAKYLVTAAMDTSIPTGIRIDIGMQEAMNAEMLVKYASEYTGSVIKVSARPWPVMGAVFTFIGLFKPLMTDIKKMYEYFFTGQYVADTTLQKTYFGHVPTVRDSVFRYCKQIDLPSQKKNR